MKTAPRTAPALAVVAIAATVTAVALAATPTPAAAQDCGKECHICGPGEWGREGVNFGGSYDMGCTGGELCGVCGLKSVTDIAPSPLAIVQDIENSPIEDLRRLVAKHSDRLLLHESRRLLAIRGSACSDDVTAVVFLSSRATSKLARLGVRALTQHALQPQS